MDPSPPSALLARVPPGPSGRALVDALVGTERGEAANGLDEIRLQAHDLLEVLVGARHLVEHRLGAGGEDLAPHGPHPRELVVERELPPSSAPAERPPGAVGGRAERLRVAEAPPEDRTGTHRARRDRRRAHRRLHRSLAMDPAGTAIVLLA